MFCLTLLASHAFGRVNVMGRRATRAVEEALDPFVAAGAAVHLVAFREALLARASGRASQTGSFPAHCGWKSGYADA